MTDRQMQANAVSSHLNVYHGGWVLFADAAILMNGRSVCLADEVCLILDQNRIFWLVIVI